MCAARHVAPTEHAVATTARTAAPTSVRHALRPAGRRIGHPQRASGRPEDWPSTPVRRGCHRSPLAMHARARVAAPFALRRPPSRPQSPHGVRRLLPRGRRCCRPGRGVGRCAPRRSVWGRNQTGLSGALLLARRRPPAGRLSSPPTGGILPAHLARTALSARARQECAASPCGVQAYAGDLAYTNNRTRAAHTHRVWVRFWHFASKCAPTEF